MNDEQYYRVPLDRYPVNGSEITLDPTGRDLDYEAAIVVGHNEHGYQVVLRRTGERIGSVTRYRYLGEDRVVLNGADQSTADAIESTQFQPDDDSPSDPSHGYALDDPKRNGPGGTW